MIKNYLVMILIPLLTSAFATGCTKTPEEKLLAANRIMLNQVASDVAVEIEPNSEKIFEGDIENVVVCGRATIRQPKNSTNILVQRFTIKSNKSITQGLARFEANNDYEFQELWTKNCPGYNFGLLPNQTHVATMQEWKSAFSGTFLEEHVNDTNDGFVDFTAKFPKEKSKKLSAFLFGRKNLQESEWFFRGMDSSGHYLGTSLYQAIGIEKGEMPNVLFNPYYIGSGAGIKMNKVAVLADGDELLQHDFQSKLTRRDRFVMDVVEQAVFSLSEKDIMALRKIENSKNVSIVLYGDNENIKLPVRNVENFRNELKMTLAAYDDISNALRNHLPQKKKKEI